MAADGTKFHASLQFSARARVESRLGVTSCLADRKDADSVVGHSREDLQIRLSRAQTMVV